MLMMILREYFVNERLTSESVMKTEIWNDELVSEIMADLSPLFLSKFKENLTKHPAQ